MDYKGFFSFAAVLLTFVGFFPYIRDILHNRVRPHVFSWVIWGTTTCVIFFAQLQGGGGLGAWPIGISALITLYVTILAFQKKGDLSITRLDWFFLLSALASLPLWFLTANPLWAVLLLTFIDLLGFGPTFRKSYAFPYEEQPGFFAIFMLRNLLVVAALEHYSWTTVTFPAAVAVVCLALIIMILLRRSVVMPPEYKSRG
ncbi:MULTISPECIES: hypothetical protein [Thiomicrorhabdus]|uniref:DUF1295 domain-containing protein n=1 Tax=Thiomicrorhabdus heinhorstiae TaxID=2748010 RepID=A0ABS0BTA4_9GAMM|nr:MULTISPECIES: hypothetical protein [Thiomicrorhabdus]MBF6057071.1 hypothetical protein [Thiomicrorhabdus heinhorstiae]